MKIRTAWFFLFGLVFLSLNEVYAAAPPARCSLKGNWDLGSKKIGAWKITTTGVGKDEETFTIKELHEFAPEDSDEKQKPRYNNQDFTFNSDGTIIPHEGGLMHFYYHGRHDDLSGDFKGIWKFGAENSLCTLTVTFTYKHRGNRVKEVYKFRSSENKVAEEREEKNSVALSDLQLMLPAFATDVETYQSEEYFVDTQSPQEAVVGNSAIADMVETYVPEIEILSPEALSYSEAQSYPDIQMYPQIQSYDAQPHTFSYSDATLADIFSHSPKLSSGGVMNLE